MQALSDTPNAIEESTSWQLHADLHLGLSSAVSWLELEGWLQEARRACAAGTIRPEQLEELLEEATRIGSALGNL